MHDTTMRNSYASWPANGTVIADRPGPRPPSPGPDAVPQDHELLLVDAGDSAQLRSQVAFLAELTGRLAPVDLSTLAATLRRGLADRPVRAAIVANSPEQASGRFARLLDKLDAGASAAMDVTNGVFLGEGYRLPRIGYLFPGQGSVKGDDGGALAARFETVRDLYQTVTLPENDDPTATIVAQPRIACHSVSGLRVLSQLGIEALAAAGHSLGELTALHWAGAMTESELLELATERGRVMMTASEGGGAMAGISASPDEVEPLLPGEPVVIACYNSPGQTIISGPAEAVERVREAAAKNGLRTAKVAVSHAFHSPLVAPAAAKLDAYLAGQRFRTLNRWVISTVTGEVLPSGADLRQLLVRQVREPVLFSQALSRMAPGVDLFIEVGPGRILSGLAAKVVPDTPAIPLGTDKPSLSGVLSAAAAAYVLGMTIRHDRLTGGGAVTTAPADES